MKLQDMTLDTAIEELDELRIKYDNSPNPSIFEVWVDTDDNTVRFTKCGWNGDIFPTGYQVPIGTSVRDTIKEIVREESLKLVTAEAWVRSKGYDSDYRMKLLGRMDNKE
jgi:hypothetical protein